MSNTLSQFDEIRPFNPEEIPAVVEELYRDESFRQAMQLALPEIPIEIMRAKALQCETLLDIQKTFVYSFLKKLLSEKSTGIDMDASAISPENNYTFISNHRDIVLDAALLSEMLVDNGFSTTCEICVGDNLLLVPWIKNIVRLNKGIIVKRGLSMRERLLASQELSEYLHYVITQKHDNIWIAQRQGRAKDSNDLTQESIFKMLSMRGPSNIIDNLKELNIVPLSISYEYDPCDFLKAVEFMHRRNDPDYRKSRNEDVLSMKTGMFGFKGKIHFQAGKCINEWLDSLPTTIHKNDLSTIITNYIDQQIHAGYRIYANNYIACDILSGTQSYASKYTAEEKENFLNYLQTQMARIDTPNADMEFIRESMLQMYANPLKNYLKAIQS